MSDELAVSVVEAARRIDLGRTRFSELVKSGAIPSRVIGSRRVVLVRDLEDYVAALPSSPVGSASTAGRTS
jgi:hypothetical protein